MRESRSCANGRHAAEWIQRCLEKRAGPQPLGVGIPSVEIEARIGAGMLMGGRVQFTFTGELLICVEEQRLRR